MPMLDEAKDFVGLHARYMGFRERHVGAVLRRITTLDGHDPGSWLREWSREADVWARSGRLVASANLYNLARFPCADSPEKQRAAESAAASFLRWLEATGAGKRRVANVAGQDVPYLFRPGRRNDAPLVILMGGPVSLKEQWGGFLRVGSRLGCAVAIADFPGVGENRVPYARSAAAVFGAIADSPGDLCDARRTLVVAPSFGGHLAMMHALVDHRISGVVTVGAPLAQFFLDPRARGSMPVITRVALSHSAGVDDHALDEHLVRLALTASELRALCVPVLYVASLRDEIIPNREWREAAMHAPRFHVHVFDDIHGSPRHLLQTRLLTLRALSRHGGGAYLPAALDLMCRVAVRSASPAVQAQFL